MAYAFSPREELRGTATITPHKNLKCRHLYVQLEWHTEGRGTRDAFKVSEVDVYQGELMQGVPTYHDFAFILPDGPWSYSGHYITIVWEVVVSMDLPRTKDPTGRIPFILSPQGR